MSNGLPDKNDEVSVVLHHFQPKPQFLAQKKTKKFGQFTSTIYKHDSNTLRLVFLHHDGILQIGFAVSTVRPYGASYLNDGGSISTIGGKQQNSLESICCELAAEVGPSGCSLFSVVSRLLLSLNKQTFHSEDDRSALLQSYISRLTSNRRLSWDLPLVLMRCAATSRHSARVCIPLPADCTYETGDFAKIHDSLISPFRGKRGPLHRREQTMIAFLASLRWTELSNLSTKKIPTDSPANQKKVKVTIDLTNVSDVTPRISKLAAERGSVTAFHGTTVDRVWSILNFGLLTHGSLQKNGAMMGEGIYLTTSYDVAYFFATKDTKPLPRQVWWQPSFWKVIGMRAPENLEDWLVTCYAVVESTIILPPEDEPLDAKNCTRRAGKYYVVPDPQDIHMNKVHITVELSKRQKAPSMFLILSILVAMAVLLSFRS